MDEIDLDAYFHDYWETSRYTPRPEERELPPLENTLTREPDLYDHLHWQLHMSDVPTRRREIAELIIGNLEPGRLPGRQATRWRRWARPATATPTRVEEVEEALDAGAQLRPAGVACSDLRESLLRQLDDREPRRSAPGAPHRRATTGTSSCSASSPHRQGARLDAAELEPAVELIKYLEPAAGRANSQRAHALRRARRGGAQGRRRVRHPAQRRRHAEAAHQPRLPADAARDARRGPAGEAQRSSRTRCARRCG